MKNQKIAYWIVTGMLSFGMLLGGAAQILRAKFNVDGIVHLGFPEYVLPILGVWKVLAIVVILMPK
jgi:DoxX-like family